MITVVPSKNALYLQAIERGDAGYQQQCQKWVSIYRGELGSSEWIADVTVRGGSGEREEGQRVLDAIVKALQNL